MRKVLIYVIKDPDTLRIRYVGKTVQSLKIRLNRHINNPKGYVGRFISKLIRKNKYPIIEKIDECDESNWQEREIYWIKYYREIIDDLCNLCDGGIGVSGHKVSKISIAKRLESVNKKLYVKHIETGVVNIYKSSVDFRKNHDVSQPSISRAIKTCGKSKGFMFSYTGIFNQNEISKRYKSKIICKCKTGEELEFDSANQAAKKLGLWPSFINRVLRKEYKHYKGYEFRYK